MNRLEYFNYIQTPDDWKAKALSIPQQAQALQTNKHTSRHNLGAVLVACAIVVSLSGGVVYAVESGVLGAIKAELFEDKYTPYNYDGVQNDILESTSTLENYAQTDVQVTNLSISREDVDLKVNSYLCDRDVLYISADLILPQGETYSGYNKNGANFSDYTLTSLDGNTSIYGYGIEVTSVYDNVVSLVMYTISDGSSTLDGDINVSFSNLGSYSGTFETYYPMDVSFNISVKDCGLYHSVENINQDVTLNNQSRSVMVSKVVYSPLVLNVYLTNLGNYTIDSQDFTMYYVYSDGRRVYIPRDYMQTTYDTYGNPNGIYLNYAHANQTLIDFTNVVAIEINGETIVLNNN